MDQRIFLFATRFTFRVTNIDNLGDMTHFLQEKLPVWPLQIDQRSVVHVKKKDRGILLFFIIPASIQLLSEYIKHSVPEFRRAISVHMFTFYTYLNTF